MAKLNVVKAWVMDKAQKYSKINNNLESIIFFYIWAEILGQKCLLSLKWLKKINRVMWPLIIN